MTVEAQDNLEARLAELTQWEGGATALWRQALSAQKAASRSGRSQWARLRAWQPSGLALASTALGALFVTAVALNIPNLSTAGRNPASTYPDGSVAVAKRYQDLRGAGHPFILGTPSVSAQGAAGSQTGPPSDVDYAYQYQGKTPSQFISPSTVAPDRQVVRRATVELRSEDVRAVFLKVQHVVHPEDGEYVEDSALSGTGRDAEANLTLRVASSRLSDVLNELRQIAEVFSESKSGQDVTAQVVDIEARLRNERRVEEEILDLLQRRENSDLKDILDTRERLAQVRQQIESLTGQREQLGKLVSLATVLVIIRATDAPQSHQGSLRAYFGESIGAAWRGSLLFLADTLATMMRILVGGALIWVPVAGGIWAIMRNRRKGGRRSGAD